MRRNGIALLVLIACHSDPPRAEAQYAKPPPTTAGATTPSGSGSGSGSIKPLVHGAAHYAQISEVAISADGTAAITRDAMGGLRVWPALDGSAEPRIVPVASPAALSIDRRADGIVAAIVDGSGAGHVVTINKDGRIAVGGLPIDPSIASLTVLPGGDRVIGVRADQSIGLYDSTGAELDHATLRSMRVAKLLARRDGARAVALVTTIAKGKPGAALVPIDASRGKLEIGAAIPLPLPLAAGIPAAGAVAPKGARVAYLAQPVGGAVQLEVVDAATGLETKVPESPAITTPMQTAIGWTGDDKLYVVGTNGGWRIEFGATIDVFASAQAPRMTLPSFGAEALVGGYGAHLAIERTDGTLRFLGYSELSPTAVSVAPGGRTVMWITSSGALMKETLDGGEVLVRTPNEWYGSVAAVDDHTALAGRNSGVLALLDMDTGKELATLPVAASTPFLQYSAKRKLVAVMAQASVVWLIPVDRAAAQPLGKPAVIADGAQTFQLLDSGDEVLLTYDSAWKGRIYSAAEIAKGVSAAQMKKDRFTAGGAGYIHDRSAQTYVLNGTEVQIWKKGTKVKAFQVEVASAVSAAPDGSRIAVTTQSGAIAVYDSDGKKLWSVGAGSFAYGVSWSDDSALLAIATQGGGLVIDAATGTARVQSCGWKFTLDTAVPQILPQNVPTVCR